MAEPITLTLGKLRQKGPKFKASLGYSLECIVRQKEREKLGHSCPKFLSISAPGQACLQAKTELN